MQALPISHGSLPELAEGCDVPVGWACRTRIGHGRHRRCPRRRRLETRELLATGERASKRGVETREDLTYLHKVFAKLHITSRTVARGMRLPR